MAVDENTLAATYSAYDAHAAEDSGITLNRAGYSMLQPRVSDYRPLHLEQTNQNNKRDSHATDCGG